MGPTEPLGIVDARARIQSISQMLRPARPAAGATTDAGTAFADRLAAASSGLGTTSPATKTAQSYAGLDPTALALQGAGYVPGATGAASAASPVSADQLDAWMREKVPDSPLVGKGAVFVQAGLANGIDPRFLVSVAFHESVLGTAGSGRDINNAFGWGPAIPFSSWEENIATVAKGLADGYVGKGLDTVAEIQGKWAPVGARNDPGDLNSNWLRRVSETLVELGGDAGGRVTSPSAQPAPRVASPYPLSVTAATTRSA